MKVAVLGCGPAGLMAVHGVLRAMPDAEVVVLSRKEKSPLHGAQYLHRPIPGFRTESRAISYELWGDADGYRAKVYGSMWDGSVSPEDLIGTHAAWDIRGTYDGLWELYEPIIEHHEIEPWMVRMAMEANDLVINSVPRPVLCTEGHNFASTQIIAAGDAPALGITLPFDVDDFRVICNGESSPSWYRLSRVFGHTTVEWPSALGRVPINSAATVNKPTKTNCDCWPDVRHVGRYGRWEKGVLSHTAYFDARDYAMQVRLR